jgi:RhoGAP domain/PH domain
LLAYRRVSGRERCNVCETREVDVSLLLSVLKARAPSAQTHAKARRSKRGPNSRVPAQCDKGEFWLAKKGEGRREARRTMSASMQALRVCVLGAVPIDMKIPSTETGQRCIELAVEQENRHGAEISETVVGRCLLYSTRKSVFVDPAKTLAESGVENGDFVKVVLNRDSGQIRVVVGGTWDAAPKFPEYHHDGKVFTVDFTEPLFRLIPRICSKFKIARASNKDEYVLRQVVRQGETDEMEFAAQLNVNLSLREQDVPNQSQILVTPMSSFAQRKLDGWKTARLEGWMTKSSRKGDKKATGKKKRWCVFEGGLLAYFANQKKPAELPKGIVGVEYMQVTTKDSSTLVMEKSTASWTKTGLVFEFAPLKQEELLAWERALTVVAANGAPFRTFGLSLQALEEREKDQQIPFVVENVLRHLREKGGVESEGIFSHSGNIRQVEKWKDMCDRGRGEEVVEEFNSADVDSVAGLLKLFLRELPEPILTYAQYHAFLATGKEKDLEALQQLVVSLPTPNQRLLRELISFLWELDSNSKNQMSLEDICKILGPNLLRPKLETETTLMQDGTSVTSAIEFLVASRRTLRYRKARQVRKSSTVPTGNTRRSRGITLSAALLGPPPPSLTLPEASPDEPAEGSKAESDTNESLVPPPLDLMMLPPPVFDLPPPPEGDGSTPLDADLPPPPGDLASQD